MSFAIFPQPTSLPPSALDQTAAPASSHAGGLAPTPQAVPEQQQQQPPQAFASLLAPTSQPPYNPAAAAPAAAPTPAPSVAQQPYPVDPYGAGGLPAQYALHPSPTPAPQTAGVAQQQPVHQPQPWEAPAPGSQPVTAPPASFAPGQQQGFPAPHQQPYTPHQQQQQYGSPAPVPHASSSGLVTPSTPAAAGAYANGHYSQTGPSLPLSHAQQKFFLGLCRQLKKLPQAYAFSAPVDPIALGIPHYHQIITHPMDLSTIEIKLQASGPKGKGKKGGVPGRYAVKEEVVEDFRRVWGNSDRFNGRDHAVSNAGRALEEVFERELARLPADEEVRSAACSTCGEGTADSVSFACCSSPSRRRPSRRRHTLPTRPVQAAQLASGVTRTPPDLSGMSTRRRPRTHSSRPMTPAGASRAAG